MAFTAITPAEVTSGEPVTTTTGNLTRTNFDDHETRISDLEAGSASTVPFVFHVVGDGRIRDALSKLRVPFNITVTGVVLRVWDAGTAGTIEVDVQADLGSGYGTILSSNVTLAFGAGDDAEASAAGLVTTDIDAGDTIRLDVKARQTDTSGYSVYVFYTERA
jgi:hypothetical protein